MLKVAMLSGWHVHAKGYANELRKMRDVRITAVWDEDRARGKAWAAELKAAFEPDLQTCLQRPDVDAVACNAPTNRHAEVMAAAASAGKHIFTEKVMALTVKECGRIADAVRKAGVKFCISFPYRTRPEALYAKKVADEKLIGDVTLIRVRVAHNGISAGWLPKHFRDPVTCGGGAMIDLGAHPMYLARWIGGKPAKISSTFNAYVKGQEIEDNAVSVIEFANKVIGIAETSFVSTQSPFSLDLYGTQGTLFVGGPENRVRIISERPATGAKGWTTPTEMPNALPKPIEQWVNGILKGTPIHFGLEEGIQLTELMEAAYKSYREGRQVSFEA
jgi:1,5-anhydro-D-fructose reductase (1,5-anhydro-D-mannitol-forming)